VSEIRRLGDRYELGEPLGRGGMAEVLEGRDLRLGRRVAVKILRPDLAKDPAFQSRFRREAQSAASLNHPNVVAVYDTGEDILGDDSKTAVVPYIVMEHVDGQTLRQLVASGRRLLPERALEITAGILAALDYSHRHGIVHRDIKPANVMLTRTGDVKVMDFGIARALADASATMTAASAVMGTAQYLSPEQARGEVVDARSDLYSTGCLLYELLTGRPPFQGDSPVSVAYQHVSEAPLPPSKVDPAVPPSLDPLVLKALAKDPDDPLAGVDDGEKKRSPWVWIGVAALVLLVAGLALFLGRVLFGATAAEQVSVPSIVSQTITQAQNTLSQQGLSLGTQTPTTSDQPKGNILSQNPQGGSQLAKGQSVAVTVSAGRAQVQVPTLTGMASSDDAQTALNEVKLTLGNVTERDSDQPEGTVLSQSPNSGTTVDEGSSVNITVSNGLIDVPRVVGKIGDQAQATLTNAGFSVNFAQDSDRTGTVSAQSPQGASKAQKGALVTLTTVPAAPEPEQASGRANDPPAPNSQDEAGATTSGSPSPSASGNLSSTAADPGGVIVTP
jgi:beta-lactam-binding protein with PASTA domain/predicted Ser/Thr protein kinase